MDKIKFTKDQQQVVDNIIKFIRHNFDENKFITSIIGAAGTGKTFITKYIIENCGIHHSYIKCASTTHKACRVFSNAIGNKPVETIQSILGLRLNLKLEDFDPKNPQFSPIGSKRLDEVYLLIIDEASMLPHKLVNYIITSCKEKGIKIIFIGDSYQLPPVNENKSIAFYKTNFNNTLKTIVRQGENNPTVDLLSMIREDIDNNTTKSIRFIHDNVGFSNFNDNKGFKIIREEDFLNEITTKFKDKEYVNDIYKYKIIAYTNDAVSNYNKFIRNIIVKDCNKSVITQNDLIMSYETIVDEYNQPIIYNSEEYIIKSIVDHNDSITGFKGFLVKFQMVNGGEITRPLFIIDHNDKLTLSLYYHKLTKLRLDAQRANIANRATLWQRYFDFKKTYLLAVNIKIGNTDRIEAYRDLDYGFALTVHKSQGSTYKNVFVDCNDIIYSKNGQPYSNISDTLRKLYVAFSRPSEQLVLCYGK